MSGNDPSGYNWHFWRKAIHPYLVRQLVYHFFLSKETVVLRRWESLAKNSSESHKTLEQKFIFQIGTLNPHGINERFSFD